MNAQKGTYRFLTISFERLAPWVLNFGTLSWTWSAMDRRIKLSRVRWVKYLRDTQLPEFQDAKFCIKLYKKNVLAGPGTGYIRTGHNDSLWSPETNGHNVSSIHPSIHQSVEKKWPTINIVKWHVLYVAIRITGTVHKMSAWGKSINRLYDWSIFSFIHSFTHSSISTFSQIRGGVLSHTQAWVLIKWKSTQLNSFIMW